MNIKSIATATAVAGLLACAAPVFAAPVTLTFEGVNGQGSVAEFYNGGTDVSGDSPHAPASGPNYHVSFGPDAVAFLDDGFAFFSNAPSPGTIMAPVGSSASLSATAGTSFVGTLSFYYSSALDFSVDVLDAGNGVLGSLSLLANNGSCGAVPLCFWSLASLDFQGAAKSIRFGGYDPENFTFAGFDDITVTSVPVPAAGWLLVSGLAVLGRMRRKRATAGALAAA